MRKISIKQSTLTILVADLERSIAFYDAIGFDLEKQWDNYYAQMSAPGLTLGLHPTSPSNPVNGSGNTSLGFTCDDFEKTKSALMALSISITERDEEGGKFIHFHDPDGTALYFIEPKW